MKILYIMSASRSGSTILEYALGSLNGIFNVGELRRLRSFFNEDFNNIVDPNNQKGCTCGVKVKECKFWNQVEKESELDFSNVQLDSQLSLANRALFKAVFIVVGPRLLRRISKLYPPFQRELNVAENVFCIYKAVGRITGADCIVDSSKQTYQFLVLKALHPDQVKLLFVYRDGRAVSHSMVRGDRINYFKSGKYAHDVKGRSGEIRAFRAAVLSWQRSILEGFLFYSRLARDERYAVRYETFCRDPKAMLSTLISWFGLNESKSKKNYQ